MTNIRIKAFGRNPYAHFAYSRAMSDSRAKRTSPLRPVEFLVLAALLETPRHGYAMVRDISRQTDGRVSLRPGDLYRVLSRLENRGLLEICDRRPAPEVDDRRRTYYGLTEKGREAAREEAEMFSKVSLGVLAKVAEEVSP